MTEIKTYRFKFTIETEDGEMLEQGSTYLIPSSISEAGECESVDMEIGKYLRIFKNRLKKEAEHQEIFDDKMGNPIEQLDKLTI